MSPKLMIWGSVLLSAVAQIFLKHGLSRVQTERAAGAKKGALNLLTGITTQSSIWLWGACFVVATGLWLLGLQKLELSYAYPLVSFGYVLVSLLSLVFFRERVDRQRWLAVVVISVGVFLIASS
jgi:undecaprenyl phosphate-alpha-L-ara4N flippase subunit ArnE